MAQTDLPLYIGPEAITHLIRYCEDNHLHQFVLVADQNTYPALGRAVVEALSAREFDVIPVVLTGPEVIADEHYLMQVLIRADRQERTYLAVGSGTITDITRFISHRTKASFISIPTAPSVDGFASVGAPLIVAGLKQTLIAHAPRAVFADLNTLSAAPQPMLAAGFGDMVGKYTSLADWKLGRLLWAEPYDEAVAQRLLDVTERCMQQAEAIGQASSEGVQSLMAGLIESGLCMLQFGSSRPASGAEHHLSHYWELKLLRENRPAILHGAKVGVASLLIAAYYEQIRQLSQSQVRDKLAQARLPERASEIQRLQAAYGAIAGEIVAEQASFLDMSPTTYELFKQKIVQHWPEIQEIAAGVPTPQTLAHWLRQVGGPIEAQALGLSNDEVDLALEFGHYLRNRFTIRKLGYMFTQQDVSQIPKF